MDMQCHDIERLGAPPTVLAVLAVLAAQATALRDRIGGLDASHVELLWQAADTISRLAALVTATGTPLPGAPDIKQLCRSLDQLAFAEAQRMDLSRQITECIGEALRRLDDDADGFSCADLVKLYVSHEQRAVHAEALAA